MKFWVAGIVAVTLLLHILSGVLLPFVAACGIAYFLDPFADWLEARKLSRGFATPVILLTFFFFSTVLLMLMFPLLQSQIIQLARSLPTMIENARTLAQPLFEDIIAGLPPVVLDNIRNAAAGFAGKAVSWGSSVLANLWSGGVAFFNMLSLVVITPVVAFYLLRDWDLIVAKVDSWLPLGSAPIIRARFSEIDNTLAAFIRGQASVCLVLSLIYAIGLSLVGLPSGLLIGLGAGLFSFIPYLGAATGLATGVGIAVFHFDSLMPIATVTGVFLFGQILESYVLTPRLVGDRVGLHPVWIIFALLAGGALFGFTGVLLAVPTAAVIGVLSRYGISRYLSSAFYHSVEPPQ